ncbi:MAG: response regulator [Thalassobaculaceae bacterium]|nr:response regulator [Thalassobaculaceae bacterium]
MVASLSAVDVLIVDDEAFVRKTLTQMLRLVGVRRVTEANNGRHALSELLGLTDQLLPNLILCDLEMDLMGGLDFLQRLRNQENEALASIPVIISTAHTDAQTVREASKHQIDGYLVKPFTSGKLQGRIEAVLPILPERS